VLPYGYSWTLLDKYYPEQSVTVTSSDPPYVTPALKQMLRQKNKLMRVENAAALATKIGLAIKDYNCAELSRANVISNAKSMWSKVRQLTGRSKHQATGNHHSALSAEVLNDHYAAISTDAHYTAPGIKSTCNNIGASSHVSEWQIIINNNNNNTRTMFMVLSSCCSSIARVHPGSRDERSTAPGGRRPLDQADRLEP